MLNKDYAALFSTFFHLKPEELEKIIAQKNPEKSLLKLGYKNSGQVHSLFYSLVLSVLLNKLNPRLYLHFLLSKIHDIRRGTIDPATLLPHTINQNELTTFANKLFADAKKVLDTFEF